ncbi:unnamed protein product [Urochloa humidicola]
MMAAFIAAASAAPPFSSIWIIAAILGDFLYDHVTTLQCSTGQEGVFGKKELNSYWTFSPFVFQDYLLLTFLPVIEL